MLKADTCRYFTGTINECCQKGIQYEAIKVPSGVDYPPMDQWALPCIERRRFQTGVICEHSSFPTPQEEHADRQRIERKLKEWVEKLENNICPHCDQKITKEQVGRCVYGSCGHRLYQGRLPKKERSEVA